MFKMTNTNIERQGKRFRIVSEMVIGLLKLLTKCKKLALTRQGTHIRNIKHAACLLNDEIFLKDSIHQQQADKNKNWTPVS